MPMIADTLVALASASPIVLALLLGIAAVCVAGFALYVAYRIILRSQRR